MGNRKHLAILKQGVETWNQWRQEHPRIVPNLVEADLRGEDLRRINLSGSLLIMSDFSGAHLSTEDPNWACLKRSQYVGADLRYSNLSQANLSGANLFDADLYQATLRGANLYDADLRWANLVKANLRETNLRGADLFRAILKNADLRYCSIAGTAFGDVDLSTVRGLETVNVTGPCTIAVDTIYKSNGNIPKLFLRRCGVPNTMITHVASLVGRPIQFYSAFISYSSKDQDFAVRLHADLQSKSVRVWFAPEDLKIGDRLRDTIEEAIRIYDKLMVVLSENSINSAWVRREVKTAVDKERQQNRTVLFPIRLDDAVMGSAEQWADDIRRDRHIGDFRMWKDHDSYQKAFARLFRDLQAESEESNG